MFWPFVYDVITRLPAEQRPELSPKARLWTAMI